MSQHYSRYEMPCRWYVFTTIELLSKKSSDSRQELSRITDQRIDISFRSADTSVGKWVQEDPTLAVIQSMSASR